jgi:hypothetical protein
MVPIPEIPSSTKATLYGVWGSGAGDVWMAGGSPADRTGPKAVLLRWNGSVIERVPYTSSETFFKVWGSGPSDVMFVGTGGTAVRWNGTALEPTSTGTVSRLVTIHGTGPRDMYAVGGDRKGVVLRWDGAAWSDVTGEDMPPLAGVFAAPNGTLFACGTTGYAARRAGGTWTPIETVLFGRDFHATFARSGDEAFFAGGQLIVAPGSRRGIIARWGPPD